MGILCLQKAVRIACEGDRLVKPFKIDFTFLVEKREELVAINRRIHQQRLVNGIIKVAERNFSRVAAILLDKLRGRMVVDVINF